MSAGSRKAATRAIRRRPHAPPAGAHAALRTPSAAGDRSTFRRDRLPGACPLPPAAALERGTGPGSATLNIDIQYSFDFRDLALRRPTGVAVPTLRLPRASASARSTIWAHAGVGMGTRPAPVCHRLRFSTGPERARTGEARASRARARRFAQALRGLAPSSRAQGPSLDHRCEMRERSRPRTAASEGTSPLHRLRTQSGH